MNPIVMTGISPLGHDAGEVRSRATELLSRPPFSDQPPGPVRRLLRFLGDRIAAVFARLFDGVTGWGLLPWVLVVLGVVVVGWLVWRITRGLTADRSIAEVPAQSVSRSAADWHRDADAAEARGALREALRCRYGAMVAALAARGALEDVPGRTVRELDTEVARSVPAIADEVAAAGRRFDDAIYGFREVTSEDLEVVATAARRAEAGEPRALAGDRS